MAQTRLDRIGKYEFESVVGEGAMGVVYCAKDSMLNRRVAIKVMSDAIAQVSNLRERFLREAQAAGSLQHPNVVTIYDFGDVDGHLYIAMEYVEGEDLEDLLHAAIPLPLESKLDLIIGVLQGLAFAHRRGIVHRDIKPANIRVDREGKARIMDFGIAHLASSDMTRTGIMLGTPSYMAPEQILGDPISAQSDIFSVGAVLYELLSGSRPFNGESLQALMHQILSVTPRPVTAVTPGLPAELDPILARALQKIPADRYATALDMANDLTMVRLAKGESTGEHALSLRQTIDTAIAERQSGIRQAARRRQVATTVAAVVGSVAILGLGYQVWRMSRADREARPASSVVSSAPAGVTPDPVAPTSPAAPATDSVRDSARLASSASESPRRTAAPPAVQTPPRPAGPTTQEVELARKVRDAGLDERRRAVDAGATADQLRSGDDQNASGDLLLRRGRTLEAVSAFNNAVAAWRTAERTARAAAAARAAATVTANESTPTPPPVPRPAEPRVTVPASGAAVGISSAPTVTAPQPPANHRPEIDRVIAAYARAIESRDLAALRQAYPGLTAEQRQAFQDFFRATRSLRASLATHDLQVDGTTAEVRLTGVYEYVTTAGNSERRDVAFRASLQQVAGAWKLTAVR